MMYGMNCAFSGQEAVTRDSRMLPFYLPSRKSMIHEVVREHCSLSSERNPMS